MTKTIGVVAVVVLAARAEGREMGRKVGELVATTQLRGAVALAEPPR